MEAQAPRRAVRGERYLKLKRMIDALRGRPDANMIEVEVTIDATDYFD